VAGYRRRRFPAWGLPFEGLSLLLVCLAFGGPLPEIGFLFVSIAFRCLYGDGIHGLLPIFTWGMALLVTFVVTGSFSTEGTGITSAQTPAILVEGLVMWLLGSLLRQRERWYAQQHELALQRERDAEQQAQSLAELNLLKDRLIERVSHELRTPLNSIRAFSELLLEYDDADAREEFLAIINSESERLGRLVDDVLDLAKIQSGTIGWQMAELDVAGLLREAERNYRPLIERRGLRFALDLGPELPPAHGDRDRLLQVLSNLLNNALKFTVQGGITAGARQAPGGVEIWVADTGVGVPEAERERIFDRFHQVGQVMEGQPRGTGLGLTICREIVAHHGGSIWVSGRAEGGAVFTFALPNPA
jgi:signal transduction histidine kinase